jgi:C1A family cysteine protease
MKTFPIKEIKGVINLVSIFKFVFGLFKKDKSKYNFGLIQDKTDYRDHIYRLKSPSINLPVSTERRNISNFPYRYNQGNLGSCVGHGVSEAYRAILFNLKKPDFEPSRLFAYYIARNNKKRDTGASIREAFKAVNKYGLCGEITWPYSKLFNQKPTKEAFKEALNHQSIKYERLPQSKLAIMDAITNGNVVVYGKQIFDSFMIPKDGNVPYPDVKTEPYHGGHCMVIFDYDENGTVELNSWGSAWGRGGTCNVPWRYVLDPNLCSDFWVFYLVE